VAASAASIPALWRLPIRSRPEPACGNQLRPSKRDRRDEGTAGTGLGGGDRAAARNLLPLRCRHPRHHSAARAGRGAWCRRPPRSWRSTSPYRIPIATPGRAPPQGGRLAADTPSRTPGSHRFALVQRQRHTPPRGKKGGSARLRKAEAGRCGVCRRRSGGARLPLPQPSERGELAGHRCERHHHLITVQTRSSAHRAIPHRFPPPPRRRVRRA
jgi:hypothetical protein